MRRVALAAGILAIAAFNLALPGKAAADSVSIGVRTDNLHLGLHFGPTPPPLVVVPGPAVAAPGPTPPPVYYAPSLPYNYFVYGNVYYLYHDGRWFRARRYNGPWTALAIAQVPHRVLAVPVQRYHNPPADWEKHGPPPWAHERQRERGWEHHDRGHGKGHD